MLANWIRQQVFNAPNGKLKLGQAIPGYMQATAGYKDGDFLFYTIEDKYNRENGIGQLDLASKTITRIQIIETLVNGFYDTSPSAGLNISPYAELSITPTIQGLTTNTPIWRDKHAELIFTANTGYLSPDSEAFVGGILAYAFDPDLEESLGTRFTFDHDVQEDAEMYPHIRWSSSDDQVGVVRWCMEFTIASREGVFLDVVKLFFEQSTTGAIHEYLYIEHQSETIKAPKPDSMIVGRVYRDSTHINDTYTGDAFLHTATFHYLSDKIGTPRRDADYGIWS